MDLAALAPVLSQHLARYADELVAFRRDLHAHPELGRQEWRTTAAINDRLVAAGLTPTLLPGSGVVCDIGHGEPVVALRADIDALPIDDEKVGVPYRSTVPGVCHACGHDVHTAVLLGVGLILAELARENAFLGRVRLVFQPAEEAMPGGALDVIGAGGIDGVRRILALHCDPRESVGSIGVRVGPITGSSDHVRVELSGAGGHTARPHLTGDLVYALAKIVTDVPSILSRRVDPRAGLSVVWGQVHAGGAANVIPQKGSAEATVRSLDARAWEDAQRVVTDAVEAVADAYGLHVKVDYTRGVPPVHNDLESVAVIETAARALLGDDRVLAVEQSLGGEDFAWYLEKVPGALFRLGVGTPGDAAVRDLHQGTFDADEGAIGVGVRVLTAAALLELAVAAG
ncbi:MAG TPA: amidohydrolase [Actinomycetes bacterium]|nr:amidohydrolase [Actinomycetes bacterium]